MASRAAAAEGQPSQHRNVPPPPHRLVTRGTAALAQQRDAGGHAIGDDVEERADDGAEDAGADGDEGEGERGHGDATSRRHSTSPSACSPVSMIVGVPPYPPSGAG